VQMKVVSPIRADLDTSIIIPWLRNVRLRSNCHGWRRRPAEDLKAAKRKALSTGRPRHDRDLREEFLTQSILADPARGRGVRHSICWAHRWRGPVLAKRQAEIALETRC